MAIYQIDDNKIIAIEETTFADRGIKERSDLQRLLKMQVDIISPDTLIVAEEFGEWEKSRRRVDLLAIDKAANIVVIELKRTEDGGHMELQAIRYAAMVSTLTFERVVEIYEKYLKDNKLGDSPRDKLLKFLEWEDADESHFGQDVRIILASAEFSKELTTAVMWLNERSLDIRCVRLKPYKDGKRTLLDVQTVIPLPEAEDYQIRIREKQQKERGASRKNYASTRHKLTINGVEIFNLHRRDVIFNIIKTIIDSGVSPETIKDIISWRTNNLFYRFDEKLNEKQVLDRLSDERKKNTTHKNRRYFSKENEIFHVDGKTYLLSSNWGGKTFDAVELLKSHFKNIKIEVTDIPHKN